MTDPLPTQTIFVNIIYVSQGNSWIWVLRISSWKSFRNSEFNIFILIFCILGNHNPVDDEWGDFVSSPLPPQQLVNGYRHQMLWQGSIPQTSVGKASPNIITNPSHYGQSGSDFNKKVSSATTTKKNMVPNLVLPELDFVAPKKRLSVTKKKWPKEQVML